MKIVTGKHYENFEDAILFPEYGKNREELKKFVDSLEGKETVVTASLELMDLILERFKRTESGELVYSNTMKSLTLKEAYELRKYLDFDLRGAAFGEFSKVSIIFCEGKTDSKFFKGVYKKLFGFKESRIIPENLKLIEKVFERDNFELLRKDDVFLAIIPSEGNAGVIRNLGNFLKAMDVFEFKVDKIGLAIDIDESAERVMESITGKLSSLKFTREGENFRVGDVVIIPLLIGYHFRHPCVEWKKPTVEDLMLKLLEKQGVLRKIERAINILRIDLKRKLKPKEVIYLALASYGFWGNLEGFYEMFVMRSRKDNLEEILRSAGLLDKLAEVIE
ncbi:DUF3226 domain-containing protein [Thermococcus paralvinellae]|uniref:Uncharacterized protein n=1 Tax=Thermococcus paralvinellae TaxID=582419 RepID=W0I977_9EURY|nr:DUF3226 domain-containing protein [Thermococcus paralvinellae]AHF81010.1 Hypothetical protein TES1_1634 [Thermococcus paralvinellae]